MSPSNRVVVLGRNGFIGSNLLRRLSDRPSVVGLARDEADVTDQGSIERALGRGDIVVNATGYVNPADLSDRGRQQLQALNVEAVGKIAEASVRRGVSQLVHVSSVAAMGRWTGNGIDEGMSRPPRSPYARSKLEAEKIVAAFADRLPVTIVRPTSVFGEGRGLARTLCRLVMLPILPLPGGGRALMPFTYVGNVAEAIALTLGNERCLGRTFIVGDRHSYPSRDVFEALARGLGRRPRYLDVPLGPSRLAVDAYERLARAMGATPIVDRSRLATLTESVEYSIDSFAEATGYEPPYGLAEAARRIAHWFRAERGSDAA